MVGKRMALLGWMLHAAACGAGTSSSGSSGGTPPDGGAASATLDCAWLGGNNCYRAAATASCLPPATAMGMLSRDGKTCTYASGAVITFDDPVTFPIPLSPLRLFKFTVTTGGQLCLRYEDVSSSPIRARMSTALGAISIDESSGITVSCPDGKRYSTSGFLSCPDTSGAPGGLWQCQNDAEVAFSLDGVGPQGGQLIWRCSR